MPDRKLTEKERRIQELFRLENELADIEEILRRAKRAEEDKEFVKASIERLERELAELNEQGE